MEIEEASQEPVEPKRKEGKFRKSPILVRRTFIIAITAFSLFLIYGSIEAIIQQGLLASIVLYSLFLVLALSGIIVGVISFRDGKNVFGIIGFILNLFLVAFIPWIIHQLIRLAILF